jgi:hypothetical protein
MKIYTKVVTEFNKLMKDDVTCSHSREIRKIKIAITLTPFDAKL